MSCYKKGWFNKAENKKSIIQRYALYHNAINFVSKLPSMFCS